MTDFDMILSADELNEAIDMCKLSSLIENNGQELLTLEEVIFLLKKAVRA